MRYRVIDPRPVSFAAGLRPSDPMRSEGRTLFEGHAQPHQSLRWILVAVPTGDLAPDEFRLDSGVWLRISWDENNGDKSQRGVVASMAEVLRGGGRLPPVLVVDRGGPCRNSSTDTTGSRRRGRPDVPRWIHTCSSHRTAMRGASS